MDDTRPRRALVCLALGFLAACGEDPVTPVTPPDPCDASDPIAMGQTVSGQLAVDDCESGTYLDRWEFSLDTETSVRIDLSSTSFDAYLELHRANGLLIAENDDAGSLDSRILVTLPAGSYVVVARSLGPGQTGSYRLTVTEGPDCSPVGDLSIGSVVTGTLTPDDCIFEWGDEAIDNWTLQLGQPTELRIELMSPDFDEVLLIRDSRGDVIWGADWSGPLGFARAEILLPAGAWTIVALAANPGGGGAYELSLGLRPPCTPGTALVLGETSSGTIDLDDCIFQGWAPADSLELTLDAETPLDIVAKSGDFPPSFVLIDSNGYEVAWGWPEYLTRTARTNVSLGAGTYAVYVFADSYGLGGYDLTVSELVCAPPTPIALDSSDSGSLDAGDCLREGGAYVDTWSLEVPADTTIRIDLESSAFDTWLELTDAEGNLLASDDDGGVGLNSRIEISLAAGSYLVRASSLGPGISGAYTLSVATPAAAPIPVRSEPEAPQAVAPSNKAPVIERPAGFAERRAEWLESLILRLRRTSGPKIGAR